MYYQSVKNAPVVLSHTMSNPLNNMADATILMSLLKTWCDAPG